MLPRCRFAPSPTGLLHVGGARTALFNLLFARSVGGRYVLRIEDTDRARSSPESERRIIDDLAWLGIEHDEGPYRQSERLDLYREAAQRLLDAGLAYRAWETREELAAMRARAVAATGGFRYRQVPYTEADRARFEAEGRRPVLRFKAPRRPVTVVDLILGEVTVAPEDQDDFVIVKDDGYPTYHFAVVVDDHHMGITHVLRAKEHLLNTIKHAQLYEALGWELPEHAHMPVINSMDGAKMSKRQKAREARAGARASGLSTEELAARLGLERETVHRFMKKKSDDVGIASAIAEELGLELPAIDVIDFRREGFLPEALVNYLALLGWSPGDDRELMDFQALCEAFSIDRVGRTDARFDPEKLRWMSGVYIRAASIERLLEAARDYTAHRPESPLAGADEATLRALLALYQPRIQTLRDLERQAGYFFADPDGYGPQKAVKKHLLRGGGLERLALAGASLAELDDWSPGGLEAQLVALAERETGGALGKLAQPLRIAVTGGPVSPSIHETLALLGKRRTLERIARCLRHFGAMD